MVHSDDLGRGRENDQETAKRSKEVTTHLCAHRPRENGREARVLEREPRQAGEGNISEYVRLRGSADDFQFQGAQWRGFRSQWGMEEAHRRDARATQG